MTRILTIRACFECSNLSLTGECSMMDGQLVRKYNDIPEWCPLPNRKDYLIREWAKDTAREHRAEKRRKSKLAAEQRAFEKGEI